MSASRLDPIGLPPGIRTPIAMIDAFEAVARRHRLGACVKLLRELLKMSRPQDWQPDSAPLVWPSTSYLCRKLDASRPTIKRHLRALRAAGVITDRLGPNGTRTGFRDPITKRIHLASTFGIDLTPIAYLYPTWLEQAELAEKQNAEKKQLRAAFYASRARLQSIVNNIAGDAELAELIDPKPLQTLIDRRTLEWARGRLAIDDMRSLVAKIHTDLLTHCDSYIDEWFSAYPDAPFMTALRRQEPYQSAHDPQAAHDPGTGPTAAQRPRSRPQHPSTSPADPSRPCAQPANNAPRSGLQTSMRVSESIPPGAQFEPPYTKTHYDPSESFVESGQVTNEQSPDPAPTTEPGRQIDPNKIQTATHQAHARRRTRALTQINAVLRDAIDTTNPATGLPAQAKAARHDNAGGIDVEPSYAPTVLTQIAPDIADFIDAQDRDTQWRQLQSVASQLAQVYRVTPETWTNATQALGPKRATAAMILTHAKTTAGDVRSPGGYFHTLLKRGQIGSLNLSRSINAIVHAQRP